MEKRLEDIQGKKQVLEKVLNEKNSKANTLQEEVYVLKERLANAQGTYKREMESEKQKVCVKRFTQSRKCLSPPVFEQLIEVWIVVLRRFVGSHLPCQVISVKKYLSLRPLGYFAYFEPKIRVREQRKFVLRSYLWLDCVLINSTSCTIRVHCVHLKQVRANLGQF